MSSTSDSINAIIMMESVALNDEARVVVEEEYVLVELEMNDDMEIDEDSYDYCDDVISMLSVEQGSSFSVCSDLPSIDPSALELAPSKEEEVKPMRRPRLISFGNDEDEVRILSERFQSSVEPLAECMSENRHADTILASVEETNAEVQEIQPNKVILEVATENPVDKTLLRSRLSNKKRRKKMKLMKKAAVAATAAAALSEMTSTLVPPPTSLKLRGSGRKPKAMTTRSSNKKVSNLAVACATGNLETYKQEVKYQKKRVSKFVSAV